MSSISKVFFKSLLSILIFCFFSLIYTNAQTKTITVTFDSNISTGTVIKAPLKYNKNVAYSFTYDDGMDDGYSPVYRYLAGGQVIGENTNFIAPGMYYTDGAGNDVAFKGAYAWVSLGRTTFGDLHINTPSYITWPQLKETYLEGWDVLNHSLRHETYPETGAMFTYPDDPPGYTGMDYSYEILKNDEYFRDNIGVSGAKLTHFIVPASDTGYVQPAWDLGYKSMAGQQTRYTMGVTGLNVFNNVDLYQLKMYRKYITSDGLTTGQLDDEINSLALASAGSNAKLWRHSGTHGIIFTGNIAGSMWFGFRKYFMDYIETNHGKSGADDFWVAGSQEVYEYVETKQSTELDTIISGNQLIINIDNSNVPDDLRRQALSLLITGTNANISDISYDNGDFTYHSENKNNGLINIEMGEYFLNDKNPDNFDLGSDLDAELGENYNSDTIILTGMSPGLANVIYLSGGGALYKNGQNIGTSGTGGNGDQFYINMDASIYGGTTISTTLKIGLQSDTYSITTQIEGASIIYLPNSSESVMKSTLISNGYNDGTGSIKGNIAGFAIGNKNISTRDSFGQILAPVVMQSSGINNRIEVQIPAGTLVKKTNGTNYSSTINIPESIETNSINLNNVISAISFGSSAEIVNFKNSSNAYMTLTYRIPVSNVNNGESLKVYYSDDNGSTRNFYKTDLVELINGQKYLEFTGYYYSKFAVTLSDFILSVNPSNNSSNIGIDDDIVIEFSKAMNQTSVENNLQISPNPGSKRYQWIGNKLYIMHDNFLNNEEYTITILSGAMDSNSNTLGSNYGFSFTTIVGASSKTWQLDFGYNSFNAGVWNELNVGLVIGLSNTSLYDSNGNQTSLYIETIKRGQDKNVTGAITNDDSGIYPDARIYKNLRGYGKYSTVSGFPEVELMAGGLDPNKTYNFKFYGNSSKVEAYPEYSKTIYTIGGQSVVLQTFQNTGNEVIISNVSPSSSGTINFSYRAYDEINRRNSYLNVLIIEENGVAVDYIPVPNSEVSNTIENEFTNGGYTKGNGALRSISADTVVGKKRISFANSLGKLLIPTVLKSANDIIEVSLPQGTILKKGGNGFTGILNKPIFLDKSAISNLDNIKSVIRIGDGTNGTISIKDQSNNDLNATLRIPAPDADAGDTVDVYYSEDNGSSWTLHGNYTVVNILGEPYAEFTTNHFTDFAITLPPGQGGGSFTGSFVINNDATSTTSQSVTLNISTTPSASQMRFANDTPSGWSSRETYSTSKARTLSNGTGTKTVYAEFDEDGDNVADVQTNDSIDYIIGGGNCVGGVGIACLNLEITAVTGSCIYGDNLDLGNHAQTYSAFTMTGNFLNTSAGTKRSCNDSAGKAPRTMQISATDLIIGNYSISSGLIEVLASAPTIYQ
ncbi:Ig-like domain-containing protein, partial [Candidatus Gracilibacteria bacterium]|nr:Ig-like domain-containing protein [Candidatus Gracilibacteria bacterium]